MAVALLHELKVISPFRSTDLSSSAQKKRSAFKLPCCSVSSGYVGLGSRSVTTLLCEGKGSESVQEVISFKCSSWLR